MFKDKESEKCKKQLEELRRKPENKRCACCSALSTPYVCLTYGTFICTRCAGLLRDINAVCKSITASKFKQAEVDKMTGNQNDEKLYLAKWNESIYKIPGVEDKERAIEFIHLKYEQLKWACDKIRIENGKEPVPDPVAPALIPEPVVEEPKQQNSVQEVKIETPQVQQKMKQELPSQPLQKQELPFQKKQKINPFDNLFAASQPVQQQPQEQQKVEEKIEQQPQQVEQVQKQESNPFADLFQSSTNQVPEQKQQVQENNPFNVFNQQPQQQQQQSNNFDDLLNW